MTASLTKTFGHKIKTLEELCDVLPPFPREKKVIICHGVFDIVHPGHLRHLIYAKEKADIVIASLTADKHITKGTYRPHVPQELRATSLAAFEIVDYVLIDKNPTPIETLAQLQPDFFAKGYEYTSEGTNPKTQEEIKTLESYGGQILFTPGDVVYSSSRLIELEPPRLKYEKLMTVMEREGLTFDSLRNILSEVSRKKVHIVGDTIVDSLTRCTMIGGQTKTPTMSVLFEDKLDFVGGAGIVAKHIRAAGAHVNFTTVLGEDDLQKFVLEDLEEAGVTIHAITDSSRPTTNKNAIVVEKYRLLKVDTLDNRSIDDWVLGDLTHKIKTIETDAVVFADFRHGLFNRRTIPSLVKSIPDHVFRVADSQVASRWGNITQFQGFNLITPNEREARFALADQDSGIRPLASSIYKSANCDNLIMKLGDRGIIAYQDADHDSLDSVFALDSFVENVVDAVGAGDALLAYATLSMLVENSLAAASILGSLAAACECERDGNIPISTDDLLLKLEKVERGALYSNEV